MQVMVKMDSAQSVREFVNIVNRYDGEMLMHSGRFKVNAKSILGIFSLDLAHPVVLEIEEEKMLPLQVERLLAEIKCNRVEEAMVNDMK